MIDDGELSWLISRIYDAAIQPELWDSALQMISDALGGAGLNIAVIDVRREARFFLGSTHLDAERGTRFLHNPIYIEPIREKWMTGLTVSPVGQLVHREAFWSDAEYRKSAIFNDIIGPQGLWHWAFAPLALDGDVLVPFSVLRAANGVPLFDRQSAELLSCLLPHLVRALQLTLRLDTLQSRTGALDALIDSLPFGVILADATAKVLRCNPAANAILSAGDGLRVTRGVLGADRAEQAAAPDRTGRAGWPRAWCLGGRRFVDLAPLVEGGSCRSRLPVRLRRRGVRGHWSLRDRVGQ